MKSKFLTAFSILLFLSIATASAGTMELSSSEGKIIIKILNNDMPIAAGKIFMKTAETLTLYKPTGTGFLGNIYAIKGMNSNLEMQFFDPVANKQLGQLEIPFTGPAGTYTFQITKIEFYNKSDYLIPFNQPLQTKLTITAQTQQPEQQQGSPGGGGGGGIIGSKAGGETIIEPEATPAGVSESNGADTEASSSATETTQNQETNKTQTEGKANTLPPIIPVIGFSLTIAVILSLILYEILHHKKAAAISNIPLSFQ